MIPSLKKTKHSYLTLISKLKFRYQREYFFYLWYIEKELSFCHKLWFSDFNIVATQCHRSLIFQTMNAIRSNNVSLKYQRFTPYGCKDIGFTKTESVAKT